MTASEWPSRVGRRRVLLAGTGAVAGLAVLSGCLGNDGDAGSEPAPDPVALDDGAACDACGMVIAEHYGPSGQVFYGDDYPEGRDGPAWFDSTRELFTARFAAEDRGHRPVATYVTDYGSVDYEIVEEDGDRYVSAHVGAETFARADDAAFVVESDVLGAMGPELLPFGDRNDAESFAESNGGRVVDHGEITPELVGGL